ncbi:enoyl-CoA hydratase [Thalassobaculum sp.]|uniref:enoyl-CoA hydratase n=1 Tax=Thalassobaculum sp. TaxID=2022740 RepID=UPI003B5A5ED0
MVDTGTEKILAEIRDATGWLTINQPERRNAISLEMWEGISRAITAFAHSVDVRSVVMTGAGDQAFTAGADISQFDKNRADADAADRYAKISRDARQLILDLRKPVIAMIRGFCMGGGLGIAMTADIRIAAEGSTFGIPAARLGIAYDTVNLLRLVRLVGPSKAKEILFTARRYSAEQALDMGLINEVVAPKDLEDTVRVMCAEIAQNAPLSMEASKLTIDELAKVPADIDAAAIQAMVDRCFNSADYKEGRAAFMEKRKPSFTGH